MPTALKSAALAAGLVASASAFAPGLALPGTRAAHRPAVCGVNMQIKPTGALIKQTFLTPKLFNDIDKDGSGTIDLEELKAAVQFTSNANVRDLIQRADLNGDGLSLCCEDAWTRDAGSMQCMTHAVHDICACGDTHANDGNTVTMPNTSSNLSQQASSTMASMRG
jgi:hypothetical protein